MSFVLCVWSGKGGVSKSTTVAHLAYLWRDRRPLVVDVDAQRAQGNFNLGGCEVLFCKPAEAPLRISQYRAARPDGLVLVDARPDYDVSLPVLRSSDAVLMPLLCERLALRAHLEGVERLEAQLPNTPRAAFVAMYTWLAREDRENAREAWGNEILKTQINKSKSIQSASVDSMTVLESEPDSRASRQWHRLAKELKERWEF